MKILVVNCGSSSMKYQLFEMPEGVVLAKGVLERIGEAESLLCHQAGEKGTEIRLGVPDHREGFDRVMQMLQDEKVGALSDISEIFAIGHRVVHGGEKFTESTLITEEVIEAIREYGHLAPLHNPPNLTGIEAAASLLPKVPQVAVFDTAFHETLPPYAYLYALPYEYYEKHRIRRYGFHGTSHRYVSGKAAAFLEQPIKNLNMVTCHLGNGCSIAAVKGGESVDTSMGFTPLEGLVMGTRSGDLDPAILPFLAEEEGLDVREVVAILNKKSGLLGLSGVSNDMREVQQAAKGGDRRAQLAVEIFSYRVKKYIGAYMAALGRLDVLVFTGGIGEHAYGVRALICSDMGEIGIELDPAKNEELGSRGPRRVSTDRSRTKVLIVPTDEEAMIAQDTFEIAKRSAGS
ncbi:MAG: acetate kinase [Candidatus Latescibacterota bacterium]